MGGKSMTIARDPTVPLDAFLYFSLSSRGIMTTPPRSQYMGDGNQPRLWSTSLPRTIAGSTPGLLDPTQPSRLHHVPGSFLHFASFHPLTALHNSHKIPIFSQENSCQPRRIVIETAPDGTSTWRFVPNARRGHAVSDEGVWPRMVYVAGCVIKPFPFH